MVFREWVRWKDGVQTPETESFPVSMYHGKEVESPYGICFKSLLLSDWQLLVMKEEKKTQLIGNEF